MNWQDLLLFTPLALGVAGAWFVAWRVSKTGNSAARGTAPMANTSPGMEEITRALKRTGKPRVS